MLKLFLRVMYGSTSLRSEGTVWRPYRFLHDARTTIRSFTSLALPTDETRCMRRRLWASLRWRTRGWERRSSGSFYR